MIFFSVAGELIDANFGQDPFVFDIEGEMKESQLRIRKKIEAFPPPGLATNSNIFCFLFVKNHGFAWRANQ